MNRCHAQPRPYCLAHPTPREPKALADSAGVGRKTLWIGREGTAEVQLTNGADAVLREAVNSKGLRMRQGAPHPADSTRTPRAAASDARTEVRLGIWAVKPWSGP
jgi:hypothetical protein